MDNYQILGRIGEGAHGIVLKAKHIQVENVGIALLLFAEHIKFCCIIPLQTGELVALKKVPLRKIDDGIPNSALR